MTQDAKPATSPPPQPCCTVRVTPEQLGTIGDGLGKLSYEIAAPLIGNLAAQYRAQITQPVTPPPDQPQPAK